jgi:protein O-mannosyl-transferase
VWPYAVIIAILLTTTVVALRQWPLVGFVGAWVFITLAPTSSIVPIATEVGAERRMYLPLAAVAALAVTWTWLIWNRLAPRRAWRGLTLALVTVAALLAFGTIARNQAYRSQVTLAERVLARWPTSFAHALLGTALAEEGRHDEAIAELRLAAPAYSRARYHLGGELFNRGALDEAIGQLQEFVRLEPRLAEAVPARTMIGQAWMRQGRWPEAVEQFRDVLAMTPGRDEAHTTAMGFLADSLFSLEKFDEARSYYTAYLSARPNDGGATTNLAISLSATGRSKEAVAAFRRAADLSPTDARARGNLGRALAEQGDLTAARVELERALQLDPANAEVRQELALILQASAPRRRN